MDCSLYSTCTEPRLFTELRTTQDSPATVMMHPGANGGAYIAGLVGALADAGVDVVEPSVSQAVSRRVDVVHVHWEHQMLRGGMTKLLPWAWIAALIARRARSLTTTYTLHNLQPHEPLSRIERLRCRVFDRCVDGVVVHSDLAQQMLTENRSSLSAVPSVTVEHGDLRAHGPVCDVRGARGRLGLDPDTRVLLALGAVRPYKQLDGLIDAVEGLGASGSVEFVIAGALHDSAVLSRLRRGLPEGVRLIDRRLDDDEVVDLVSACDAVVANYRSIHTSGAAYLALSYGKRFVGPAIGLLPEVAHRYPKYVELFEPPLSAVKLGEILDDISWREHLGPAPISSWTSIADGYTALYRMLHASGDRPK